MLAKEFELAKERQAEFMGDRYCIALANSLNQVLTQNIIIEFKNLDDVNNSKSMSSEFTVASLAFLRSLNFSNSIPSWLTSCCPIILVTERNNKLST